MPNFYFIPNYLMKIGESVENPKLWAILTAIGLFFSQYVFHQWGFAIGFMIIFIMDTVSGVYVAARTNEYSGKLFRTMLMDKCVAYFTIIIAFSAGTKIMLQNSDTNLIQYLNIPFYSLFIAAELRSIVIKWYRFKGWSWLGDLLQLMDKDKKERIDDKAEPAHIDSDPHE
jgi:hypothetical protein